MRKVIAAINMTIDGFCDHTAVDANEQVHDHYTRLLGQAGAILYGRITYQLMEFWPTILETPSDERSMNDFAQAIDKVPKIVFSRTLKHVDWKTATLSDRPVEQVVRELRAQDGKDIFIGSRSLIIQLMQLDLIDELQLCVHPVVAGGGRPLFEHIGERKLLKLAATKYFDAGAIILYYKRVD